MKKITLLVAAILLFTTCVAIAQDNNSQNRRRNSQSNRMYDPGTITRLEGIITEIKTIDEGGGRYGVHLKLQTATNDFDVHLGPAWYVNKQNAKLMINDKVIVTGSQITYNGSKAIVAAKVEKGSMVIELRQRDGRPLWSDGGRNR